MRIFFEIDSIKAEAPTVLKSMSIDYSTRRITKYMLGKMCENGLLERANPHLFFSAQDVKIIMLQFANQKMCACVTDKKFQNLKNISTGFFDEGNNIWRSHE